MSGRPSLQLPALQKAVRAGAAISQPVISQADFSPGYLLLKIIANPRRTGKPLYFTRNILLVPVDPLVQITAYCLAPMYHGLQTSNKIKNGDLCEK